MNEARQKTHFVLILDKSGSMSKTAASTIVGFNEQIQQAKESAKDQDILLSVVTFNGDVFVHQWDVNAENAAELTAEEYKPNGATAMLDAIGYSLSRLLEAGDYDDENTAFLITVISDGETNKDAKYNWNSVSELISSCEAKDNWTFNFIGCDRDYMERVANRVGLSSIQNVALFDNKSTSKNTRAYGAMAASTSLYFGARAGGMKKSYAMYDSALENISEDVASPAVAPEQAFVVPSPPARSLGGCCRGGAVSMTNTVDTLKFNNTTNQQVDMCCKSEPEVKNSVLPLGDLANKYTAAKTVGWENHVQRVVW